MTSFRWFATASAIALSLSLTAPANADVKIDDILKDHTTPGDVVTNGMGLQGQRFSTLKTVNKDNVSDLVPAWAFSLGGEKQRGQESQPLVKDGVMYVTGSYSRAWAIDTKTGRELWQYDHRLPEGILPCCDVINRGGALIENKFIFGTLDAKIVALDAKTGKVVWTKEIDDFKAGYSNTAAPLIVPSKAHGPLVVTGVSPQGLRWRARLVTSNHRRPHGQAQRQGFHDHRQDQRELARRSLEDWRRRHLARRHLRSRDLARVLRHRQPGSLEQPHASRRQQVVVRAHRDRS